MILLFFHLLSSYQDFVPWLILRFVFWLNFPNIWVLISFILLPLPPPSPPPPPSLLICCQTEVWQNRIVTSRRTWWEAEQDGEDWNLKLSIIWDNVSHYHGCWLCWLRKHALQDLISRFLPSFPRTVGRQSGLHMLRICFVSGSRNWKASGVCRCLSSN